MCGNKRSNLLNHGFGDNILVDGYIDLTIGDAELAATRIVQAGKQKYECKYATTI